jgi:cobalt-zinc-cadmium efflux system membrane fusion protein
VKKYYYFLIFTAILIVGALWGLLYSASANMTVKNGQIELGMHNGRVFHQDGFSIELLIFEKNSPPKFHAYTTFKGQPIPPTQVKLTLELIRLDGEHNQVTFRPEQDYLVSNEVVAEPHSFDVKTKAIYQDKRYEWTFPSYEGRTQLGTQAAKEGRVKIETAGPGILKKIVYLTGRIALNRNTTTDVRARFPGVVKAVFVKWGDTVKKGDLLATIESNESLKDYEVRAPSDGRILTRNIGVGNVAGSEPLFTLANLSDVWAELHVFPRDLGKINEGQMVTIHSQEGEREAQAPITMLLPTTDPLSQTVIAIVTIANPKEIWRPGTIVTGDVLIEEKSVPILIKVTALQNSQGSPVVFIKVGNQYEMRPVKLGENDGVWVEVKSGLKAGTHYVTANSFLIKADIEKSGAEHDH